MDGVDAHSQAAFLAQVAHNLTVSARDARDTLADEPERLRRYNEIQHLLTARVASLLKGSEHRYPSLFKAIDECAGPDAIGQQIRECVDWALGLALKQNGRS